MTNEILHRFNNFRKFSSKSFTTMFIHYEILQYYPSHLFTIFHNIRLHCFYKYGRSLQTHSIVLYIILRYLSTLTQLSGFVACINVSILKMFLNPPLNNSHTQFLFKTFGKLCIYTYFEQFFGNYPLNLS